MPPVKRAVSDSSFNSNYAEDEFEVVDEAELSEIQEDPSLMYSSRVVGLVVGHNANNSSRGDNEEDFSMVREVSDIDEDDDLCLGVDASVLSAKKSPINDVLEDSAFDVLGREESLVIEVCGHRLRGCQFSTACSFSIIFSASLIRFIFFCCLILLVSFVIIRTKRRCISHQRISCTGRR